MKLSRSLLKLPMPGKGKRVVKDVADIGVGQL